MLAVFVYSSFREEKPCVHTPDSSTINDSFLDTVTRLIGCELLLGSSVFSLSVFHPLDGLAVQVITRSSATGRFPCSTIADGGTRTGGSWTLTPSCFSFFFFCSGEFLQLQYSGCSWGKVCLSLHWLDNGMRASFVP